MKIRLFLLVFTGIWTISHGLYAQSNTESRIAGILTDSEGQSMDNVTTLLLQERDSSFVSGCTSDQRGTFQFKGVPEGEYLIRLSMIGYRTKEYPIRLSANEDLSLGTITLEEDSHLLEEALIVAKKKPIQWEPGKTTIHLSSMLMGTDGNLAETLKSMPGVHIQQDGTIVLNGQAGATVFINNKETYLSGENLIRYLRSIPSSSVEQIELITHPSAQYDAGGQAGKINIRIKKTRVDGFNLPVFAGYQQGKFGKGYAGCSLNLKKDRINLHTTYSYNQGKDDMDSRIHRNTIDAETGEAAETGMHQLSYREYPYTAHYIRGGVDYEWTEKTDIGAYASVNVINRTRKESLDALFHDDQGYTGEGTYTTSRARVTPRNFTTGGNVTYRPRQGAEWQTAYDYLSYSLKEDQSQTSQTETLPYSHLRGDLDGKIRIHALQSDLTLPIHNKHTLCLGVKSTFTSIDNSAVYTNKQEEAWTLSPDISSAFTYKENIYAGYIKWNAELHEKILLEAGLRIENTQVRGNLYSYAEANDSSFRRKYTHLFPNATLRFNLSPEHALSLLYGRRITRPNYRDLNPFIEVRDNYLYEQGNTDLRPQLTQNFELSYLLNNKFSFQLFFNHTTDPITKSFIMQDAQRVNVLSTNLTSEYSTGFRFNGSLRPLRCWSIHTVMNFNYKKYQWEMQGQKQENNLFTPSLHLMNQLELPRQWSMEATFIYQGKSAEAQATIHPVWMISAGVGKKITEKLSLKVYANDIFSSFRTRMDVNIINLTGTVWEKWDNTYVALHLSYQIGRGKTFQKNQRKNLPEESKRINL